MNDNMSNLREGFFPRFIDRPRLIGIFEMDEFMLAFGVVAFVLVLSFATPDIDSLEIMLIAIFSGFFSGYFYKKFKKNNPNGYTMHFLYKIGAYHPLDNKYAFLKYPYLKKNKPIPYGFTKEFYN